MEKKLIFVCKLCTNISEVARFYLGLGIVG